MHDAGESYREETDPEAAGINRVYQLLRWPPHGRHHRLAGREQDFVWLNNGMRVDLCSDGPQVLLFPAAAFHRIEGAQYCPARPGHQEDIS